MKFLLWNQLDSNNYNFPLQESSKLIQYNIYIYNIIIMNTKGLFVYTT